MKQKLPGIIICACLMFISLATITTSTELVYAQGGGTAGTGNGSGVVLWEVLVLETMESLKEHTQIVIYQSASTTHLVVILVV